MSFYPFILKPNSQHAGRTGGILGRFLGEENPSGSSGRNVLSLLSSEPESQPSVVNGPLAGKTLNDMLAEDAGSLFGRQWQNSRPPVDVRIVEVDKQQPISVFPSHRLNTEDGVCLPNNVFWYSLGGEAGSEVAVGIKPRVTRTQFLAHLNTPKLKELLEVFAAPFGDAFFVPGGHIHSVGAGNLLLEVRSRNAQPLTIGTWDEEAEEKKTPGEEVLGCIRFASRQISRIRSDAREVGHTRRIPLVHLCPDFVIDEIRIVDYFFDRTDGASFQLLCPVQGSFAVEVEGSKDSVEPGNACLIPASCGDYRIYAVGGCATVVRIAPQVAIR